MDILGFDIMLLAGVWYAAAFLMILLIACTVRLAAVPLLEAVTRARRLEHDRRCGAAFASRLASIEARLDGLAARGASERESRFGSGPAVGSA